VIDDSRGTAPATSASLSGWARWPPAGVESPRGRVAHPGQASNAPPRDFAQRHPAADVEEFDTFPRCVRDGTPPGVTGRDALAAFDLAVAANWSWHSGRPVAVKPVPVEGGVVYKIEES
jgi:predicted dehydrogenase